jgi:hypothetical protein
MRRKGTVDVLLDILCADSRLHGSKRWKAQLLPHRAVLEDSHLRWA